MDQIKLRITGEAPVVQLKRRGGFTRKISGKSPCTIQHTTEGAPRMTSSVESLHQPQHLRGSVQGSECMNRTGSQYRARLWCAVPRSYIGRLVVSLFAAAITISITICSVCSTCVASRRAQGLTLTKLVVPRAHHGPAPVSLVQDVEVTHSDWLARQLGIDRAVHHGHVDDMYAGLVAHDIDVQRIRTLYRRGDAHESFNTRKARHFERYIRHLQTLP